MIGVNTTDFRVSSFLFDYCQWPSTIVRLRRIFILFLLQGMHELVTLFVCVMEDRSCIEKWMVEGATPLKKVCRMDGRR
jgi:hypothetical protein